MMHKTGYILITVMIAIIMLVVNKTSMRLAESELSDLL
jgi:hypothetical protein